MKKALIVVDVQNDFCPGGNLPVSEGDKVVPVINKLMQSGEYNVIVATKDWHPLNHKSFFTNYKDKKVFDVVDLNGVFQVLWPVHCVQGTSSSEFHPDLLVSKINMVLHKGANKEIDSYSAFLENDGKTITGLEGYLKDLGIDEVHVCGLAMDYCVKYTALDAIIRFKNVSVIEKACRGVSKESTNEAIEGMKNAGITIIF